MRTQDDVRQFIREQSEMPAAGKGALAEWSRGLGRNDAYLHQFIHRRSPKKLDEEVRKALAALMNVPEEMLRASPEGQDPAAPDVSAPAPATRPTVQEAILGPDVSDMRRGPRDVPVLGITVGGDTDDGDDRDPDFWLNGEVVNYVVRPAGLSHVKDLFSVYVQGDSMWPRYEENDLVFLTKAAPAIGDDVVIELHKTSEGGDHATFVKRLVRRRGSYLTVRQYNPDKEIDFSMKEIKNLFRVIPTKEWVG